MPIFRGNGTAWIALAALLIEAAPARAQTDESRIEALESRTAVLAEELETLRSELEAARQAATESDSEAMRTDVTEALRVAQQAQSTADEWSRATTSAHLTGYAAAGFTDEENGTGVFDVANFNPIFHFRYGDRLLWESELEIEVAENGETDIAIEYSTIDVFLNDYLVFMAGKFNAPVGYFRQNLHPAWINKLPSAPPGFGHDGAAPLAEVGFQLRGGRAIGDQSKITYSGYVGNGPRLEGEDGELHGIDTDGFTGDDDGERIVGGRFSVLPLPKLEIGISAAFGDAAIVVNDDLALIGDPARDYKVSGIDIAYQWSDFDVRGEYIQQDIGDAALSVAPTGGEWETWYLQGAYKFGQAKWEGVLRYTDFDSPHADEVQEQWAIGLNYLLTPSAIIKLGYEFNDGLANEQTDSDRWLLQVAYGY